VDPAQATLSGWTGWLLPLLAIALLAATRRLPVPGPVERPTAAAGRATQPVTS
jgi:hypothetical protein